MIFICLYKILSISITLSVVCEGFWSLVDEVDRGALLHLGYLRRCSHLIVCTLSDFSLLMVVMLAVKRDTPTVILAWAHLMPSLESYSALIKQFFVLLPTSILLVVEHVSGSDIVKLLRLNWVLIADLFVLLLLLQGGIGISLIWLDLVLLDCGNLVGEARNDCGCCPETTYCFFLGLILEHGLR